MMLKVFSLLDLKAGAFTQPFFMPHAGQAIRAVCDLGADLSTTVGRHPADFQLCEIGTFDDVTGVLTSSAPVPFGTVLQLLPPRAPAAPLFVNPEPEPIPGWTNGAATPTDTAKIGA